MARWSYQIDGAEINTDTYGYVEIPELDSDPLADVILVPIDGSYPAAIRLQPKEGTYSIVVRMGGCSWSDWALRLAALKAILTPGAHTLRVQARGMSAAMQMRILVRGCETDARGRVVTFAATAPNPVLQPV